MDPSISANAIRGVAKDNPLGYVYWAASNAQNGGPIAPYTGATQSDIESNPNRYGSELNDDMYANINT